MSDSDPTERWRIAIHEAGHCVAGLELGGHCNGAILSAAGGLALVGGLFTDRHVYMVAAGPQAERLSEKFDAPTVEKFVTPIELTTLPPLRDAPALNTCSFFADIAQHPKSSVSDHRQIAEWAISGFENDPDRWAERVKFCYHIAEKIVEKNSEAIVRVARALFVAGRLTGKEIKSLMKGDARNECQLLYGSPRR